MLYLNHQHDPVKNRPTGSTGYKYRSAKKIKIIYMSKKIGPCLKGHGVVICD